MWIYYASVIVFLGAELTQVVTRVSGVTVEAMENAVLLTEPKPPEQRVEERVGLPCRDVSQYVRRPVD